MYTLLVNSLVILPLVAAVLLLLNSVLCRRFYCAKNYVSEEEDGIRYRNNEELSGNRGNLQLKDDKFRLLSFLLQKKIIVNDKSTVYCFFLQFLKKCFFYEYLGRYIAYIAALISFSVALILFFTLKNSVSGVSSYVLSLPLSLKYNINYSLQVDNLSIYFILLNTFITLIALFEGPYRSVNSEFFGNKIEKIIKKLVFWRFFIEKKANNQIIYCKKNKIEEIFKIGENNRYYSLIMLISLSVNLFFLAKDLIIFYIAYEFVLIPTFIIIGIWGGKEKTYAALKFFIYTLFFSVMSLAAIIYLVSKAGSGDIGDIISYTKNDLYEFRPLIWLIFFLSFAVKIPMVPLHTWLPDAHVQAPTGGSIVLAAVLLKMGGYGMQRFLIPLLPDVAEILGNYVVLWSCLTMVYASLLAFFQKDMKKMIAYSSIAHMAYITAALFCGESGQYAGLVQMISHGLISAAMFLLVGVISEKTHSKLIADYSGIAHSNPTVASFFVFFTMASIGLPGTSGFIAELLSLMAIFNTGAVVLGMLMATGMVLGAAYMLKLVARIIFGLPNEGGNSVSNLAGDRFIALSLLAVLVVWIGCNSGALFGDALQNSIGNLRKN